MGIREAVAAEAWVEGGVAGRTAAAARRVTGATPAEEGVMALEAVAMEIVVGEAWPVVAVRVAIGGVVPGTAGSTVAAVEAGVGWATGIQAATEEDTQAGRDSTATVGTAGVDKEAEAACREVVEADEEMDFLVDGEATTGLVVAGAVVEEEGAAAEASSAVAEAAVAAVRVEDGGEGVTAE